MARHAEVQMIDHVLEESVKDAYRDLFAGELRELEALMARVRSLETSHQEVSAVALEAIAERSQLGRQVEELKASLAAIPMCENCRPKTTQH